MSLNTAIQKAMFALNKSARPACLRLSYGSKCLCLMLGFTPRSSFHNRHPWAVTNECVLSGSYHRTHVLSKQLCIIIMVLYYEWNIGAAFCSHLIRSNIHIVNCGLRENTLMTSVYSITLLFPTCFFLVFSISIVGI